MCFGHLKKYALLSLFITFTLPRDFPQRKRICHDPFFLCCWESINSFFTRKLAHLELVISVWSSFYLLTYFFFPKVALKVNEMLHNWLKSNKKVQIEEVLKRAKNINVFSSFMKRIALKGPIRYREWKL